jgi:hypothetical protein
MKPKTYIRLLLFILIVSISILFFSYSRKIPSAGQKDRDCNGKCDQKKIQTEFILWESLSRNLLSGSR